MIVVQRKDEGGNYEENATMPSLWVTGTNDFAYPLDSVQKSYNACKGPVHLAIGHEMGHSHCDGWAPREIAAFTDALFKGDAPLPCVSEAHVADGNLVATVQSHRPLVRAEIIYTRGSGMWQDRRFNVLEATSDGVTVSAAIQPMTTVAYLNVWDAGEGDVRLHVDVDVRNYPGSHPVISGIVRGAEKPDEEVWAIAHLMEPGALDNAVGVAASLESARLINALVENGTIPRPRRSIRFVHDYEMFGSAALLDAMDSGQVIGGMYLDVIASRPDLTPILNWFNAPPMCPAWVDHIGAACFRQALKVCDTGYKFRQRPWPNWCPNLAADPASGFPAPWPTTVPERLEKIYDAYHSSADTEDLVSMAGLKHAVVSTAAFLYRLAATDDAMLTHEATLAAKQFKTQRERQSGATLAVARCTYEATLNHLAAFSDDASLRKHVRSELKALGKAGQVPRSRPGVARTVPSRLRGMSVCDENMPIPIREQIQATGLPAWSLYWADGQRDLGQIRSLLNGHLKKACTLAQVRSFFDAHQKLGFVRLRKGANRNQ